MRAIYLCGEYTCMMESGITNSLFGDIYTTNKENTLNMVKRTVTGYQTEDYTHPILVLGDINLNQ